MRKELNLRKKKNIEKKNYRNMHVGNKTPRLPMSTQNKLYSYFDSRFCFSHKLCVTFLCDRIIVVHVRRFVIVAIAWIIPNQKKIASMESRHKAASVFYLFYRFESIPMILSFRIWFSVCMYIMGIAKRKIRHFYSEKKPRLARAFITTGHFWEFLVETKFCTK